MLRLRRGEGGRCCGRAHPWRRRTNEVQADLVRRIFREFASDTSPQAIARQLNGDGIPASSGKFRTDSALRGHAKRGTGIINNELYIGRLVWNRKRYVKNPETGKSVLRVNPPEDRIVTEVPELRIVDDELWQAVKARQGELSVNYATVIEAVRGAHANCLNSTHRPRHLLSGLLECGVRAGPWGSRYGHDASLRPRRGGTRWRARCERHGSSRRRRRLRIRHGRRSHLASGHIRSSANRGPARRPAGSGGPVPERRQVRQRVALWADRRGDGLRENRPGQACMSR